MHLDRQVVSFWGFAKHESMLLLLFILYYSTTERIFKASNTSELTFLKLPCWLAVLSANVIYLYLSFAENKCWGTEPYMAAAHNERFCSCCKAFKNKML